MFVEFSYVDVGFGIKIHFQTTTKWKSIIPVNIKSRRMWWSRPTTKMEWDDIEWPYAIKERHEKLWKIFFYCRCLVWLTKHVRVTTGWIECWYFKGNETQRRREQIFKLNNWKRFYFFHLICLTLLFLFLFFSRLYSSWRWWECVLFFSSIKITKFWLTLTWWSCELLLGLHEMLGL